MSEIFVIEDNEVLAEAVIRYLEVEGHSCTYFRRLQGVIEALNFTTPNLLILDVMLPDGDGFLFARKLKQSFDLPILFLTARSTESDRITGLELGAEDYMVKPFSMRELVLRTRNILKKNSREDLGVKHLSWSLPSQKGHTQPRTLLLDEQAHLCVHNGEHVYLTAAEWKILHYLASHEGIVKTREQILGACLDYRAEGSQRSVNTHMKNIRAKLKDSPWIETVRGFGYRFAGKVTQL